MVRTRELLVASTLTIVAACGGDDATFDAGHTDAARPDAATLDDAGPDSAVLDDAGPDAEPVSPYYHDVVFNEVLSDGTADEDANGDGTIDAMEDEFVELVNVSAATIDLSGWTLVDTDWGVFLPRHTFPAETQLTAHGAAVVFGGGDPPASFATVLYATSNAQDPGTAYGLDLDNDGDRVTLRDSDGLVVDVFVYGNEGGIAATDDQSMTRDPDLTGDFTRHTEASGAAGAVFSPGTRVDGTAF